MTPPRASGLTLLVLDRLLGWLSFYFTARAAARRLAARIGWRRQHP